MPANLFADFRLLTVPGLHGSGPEHWQSRWEIQLPQVRRVEQEHWDVPELEVWSKRLAQELRQSSKPALLIAHSFGCLTTVHRARFDASRIAGALLVAPADPVKFGVAAQLSNVRLAFPAVVIGSTDDPWMSSERAAHWARQWQAGFVNAGALGHINADSGLGDWQYGLDQLSRLAGLARLAEAERIAVN
jgi:predicted alpha/beta hydrolase family esterase